MNNAPENEGLRRLKEIVTESQTAFAAVLNQTKVDEGEDAVKVFHHIERFGQFLRGNDDHISPITAELWPSLSCDARCAMCTYTVNRARRDDDLTNYITLMNDETFIQIVDRLKTGSVASLIFTGGGEPLLNPSMQHYAKYARDNGFAWGMFTHGLHLTEALAGQLFQNDPRFIRISMNGWTPLLHNLEYGLGTGAFYKVVENIISAAGVASSVGKTIGVGFALEPKTGLAGCETLHHLLDNIISKCPKNSLNFSFRPKIPYYLASGEVRQRLASQADYHHLQNRLQSDVLEPLQFKHERAFGFDNKSGQFNSTAEGSIPEHGLSLGWASQFDHLGNGYVLSELNGSPFDDAKIGNIVNSTDFTSFLSTKKRTSTLNRYRKKEKMLPINSKTSHVDRLLGKIRSECGILNVLDVHRFNAWFKRQAFVKPRNWDFL